MARTVYERLAGMPAGERAALVGTGAASLLAVRELGPEGAAEAFGSWACPEYLAGALGLEYRCPDPPGAGGARCRRCAAAFLRMRL